MRNWITGLACLSLIACGQSSPDDTAEPANQPAPTQPVLAADGAPAEGRYRAVSETGEVLIEELRADGTYTFFGEDGAVIDEGSYDQRSPETVCFTSSAQGTTQICYADAIGGDGVWRSTDPNTGEASVITRIEDE